MPRDINGNYTLPSGNPVTPGTLVESLWANNTMSDVATALTNSLSRSGNGGMLASFKNADGNMANPGISWTNEPTSGWYRPGFNDFRFSVGNDDVLLVGPTGIGLAAGKQLSVGGQFLAPDLPPATPQYSWASEPNSGWHHSAPSAYQFVVGGTPRLRIDASTPVTVLGNLGVRHDGGSDTNYALDVLTSSADGQGLRVRASPGQTQNLLVMAANSGGFLGGFDKDGLPWGGMVASNGEMVAAAASNKMATPASVRHSPFAVKAWGFFQGGDGAFVVGVGYTSSKIATGDYWIYWTNPFTGNYALMVNAMSDAQLFGRVIASSYTLGQARVQFYNPIAGVNQDPNYIMFIACGAI
jgi:hypothetical protein